jgi:hypothetical protein
MWNWGNKKKLSPPLIPPLGGKPIVSMNYYSFKNESELKSSLLEEGLREVKI